MIQLFRLFIPISTFTVFLGEILLAGGAFTAATYLAMDVDPTGYLLYDGGVLAIIAVIAVFLLGMYFNGMYSDVRVPSRVILLYRTILITGVMFLFEGLISAFAPRLRLPIRVMLVGSCLALVAVFSWRLFFSRFAIEILGSARVLLVGTDPVLAAVGAYIGGHPQTGLQVAGYVHEDGEAHDCLLGLPDLGAAAALPEIVRKAQPSLTVVGTRLTGTVEFARTLEDLRYAGKNIENATDTYEKVCGRVWVRGITPADLIYSSRFTAPVRHMLLQRLLHPALVAAALPVLLPLMGLVWLGLKRAAAGPVFLRERRAGQGNRSFTLYRFRLPESRSAARSGVVAAIANLHLDGLPQLFNILKGDMALAGPRAARPEFAALLSEWIPYYPQRQCVRPGITGWAQVQNTPEPAGTLAVLEYDLYYIKHMSMGLDALILFQALRSIFRGSGDERRTRR